MINKVLAIIVYMSCLCDSKLIVQNVVWRGKQNKGRGAFINPRWGLYIYICIHVCMYVCMYVYIYIYIYMYV